MRNPVSDGLIGQVKVNVQISHFVRNDRVILATKIQKTKNKELFVQKQVLTFTVTKN